MRSDGCKRKAQLADAGAWLSRIHWTRWTRQGARGVGVYHWNDCKPYCYNGHYHARAGSKITLSWVARCKSKGYLQFRRLKYTVGRRAYSMKLSCTFR